MVDILKGKGSQIKGNMKQRVDAITLITDNASNIADDLVTNITGLKPVVAVCEAGKKAGNGVFDFIKKQAEITRGWAPI